MLEMARDDPLHYIDEDSKERIHKARSELHCDVCRAVLEHTHGELMKRPKSMRKEEDILSITEVACQGGKDLSVPNYFGVEPPPLPPIWTDRVRPHLHKKHKHYNLKAFKGK